jgi:hypothetical protein
MSDNSIKRIRRIFVVPSVVSVVLWCVSLVYVGVLFVTASLSAKASAHTALFLKTFLGMPVLEGFRNGPRIGVHIEWGIFAFLVIPLLVGIALTIVYSRRAVKSDA